MTTVDNWGKVIGFTWGEVASTSWGSVNALPYDMQRSLKAMQNAATAFNNRATALNSVLENATTNHLSSDDAE